MAIEIREIRPVKSELKPFVTFPIDTLYADNPIFTWTPPTTNCSSLGLYVYSLKVAILLPGQSPTEAMANGAFYENKSFFTNRPFGSY